MACSIRPHAARSARGRRARPLMDRRRVRSPRFVTSPPYFNLKDYEHGDGQMGDIQDYEVFLTELDRVWKECAASNSGRSNLLRGRDVCVSRREGGRHYIFPLHSDIQVRARRLGLDCLTPILWHKIANGATEAEDGAGFYGKPYQPGAVVKNDIEHILFSSERRSIQVGRNDPEGPLNADERRDAGLVSVLLERQGLLHPGRASRAVLRGTRRAVGSDVLVRGGYRP